MRYVVGVMGVALLLSAIPVVAAAGEVKRIDVSVLRVSTNGRALDVKRSTDVALQTVDVLGKCGTPTVGEPRIRDFRRVGATVAVTFGKHCAADLSLVDLSVICRGCD